MPELDIEKKKQRFIKARAALDGHFAAARYPRGKTIPTSVVLDGNKYTKPSEDNRAGRGGHGTARVFVKEDDKVIMKIANAPDITLAKEFLMAQMAHDEAPSSSRVVPSRAWGRSKDCDMLVMDLMPNGDTEKMLRRLIAAQRAGDITASEYREAVCYLAREIAQGLRQIHSANIVHRDIKPDNVFLDAEMNVKIGDFGLATWNGDRVNHGHDDYSAPEELGENKDTGETFQLQPTSPAVDIHCLGKTLQRFAVEGPTQLEDLKQLAEAMTARDPKARPSVEDVASHTLLAGSDVQAKAILERVKQQREKAEAEKAKAEAAEKAKAEVRKYKGVGESVASEPIEEIEELEPEEAVEAEEEVEEEEKNENAPTPRFDDESAMLAEYGLPPVEPGSPPAAAPPVVAPPVAAPPVAAPPVAAPPVAAPVAPHTKTGAQSTVSQAHQARRVHPRDKPPTAHDAKRIHERNKPVSTKGSRNIFQLWAGK